MVVINQSLVDQVLDKDPWLREVYEMIMSDPEVNALWEMSNIMVVKRLKYNDHGPVHAKIAAGAALYLYNSLLKQGVSSTLVEDGVVGDVKYTYLVPLIGSLLHDIGNSIHRDMHEKLGSLLAYPILERLLPRIIDDNVLRTKLRQEIMHSIYCTAYELDCLTIEAGCVKIGDGLDMAEGRARVPYKLGGITIHSISALSISRVEIVGEELPIKIYVHMVENAGIFQIDEILVPKIKRTKIGKYLEVYAVVKDNVLKRYTFT